MFHSSTSPGIKFMNIGRAYSDGNHSHDDTRSETMIK
jgi:hypothetical protein